MKVYLNCDFKFELIENAINMVNEMLLFWYEKNLHIFIKILILT